jgi:hypothetical protein
MPFESFRSWSDCDSLKREGHVGGGCASNADCGPTSIQEQITLSLARRCPEIRVNKDMGQGRERSPVRRTFPR